MKKGGFIIGLVQLPIVKGAVAENLKTHLAYIAQAAAREADAQLLAAIAKRHQYSVLLVNHISNTGNWQTCGKSGGWNALGELTVAAVGTEPSLILWHVK